MMFTYKTFNNIAAEGITALSERKLLEVTDNPDGLILRSHKLVKEEFAFRSSRSTNELP